MTIVLGYDESPGADRALETAVGIASRLSEPLVLVFGAHAPGALGEELTSHQEALEEFGRGATGRALARARELGVEAEVAIVPSKPAEALIEVAEQRDATLIVVGTYGESPLRGALLGSTPHRLLHLSTRPVLVVPAPAGPVG